MSFFKIKYINKTTSSFRKVIFSAGFFVVVLSLSGCGGSQPSGKRGAFEGRNVNNARQSTVTQNIEIDDLRDIAASDGNQTAQATGVKTIDGQFMDLKPNLLFEENIRDDDDRFDRLEYAVQDIRNEFDKMTPAINRLISIENDIKELHEQLSILVDSGGIVATPIQEKTDDPVVLSNGKTLNNVNLPVPERPKDPVKTPKKTYSKSVTSPQINIADHSGKTRVVFETPQKESYNLNFDSENQLITIETKASVQQSLLSKMSKRSKKIVDITHDTQSNTVAILTKNITSVSDGNYLAPTAGKNYHRYYFDLFH